MTATRDRAAGLRGDPGHPAQAVRGGRVRVPCALIIGRRKASTDTKTSLNEAAREYGVAV